DTWLRDNPDDVNWKRFHLMGEVVKDYYNTHAVLNPNDKIGAPLFRWAMSVPQRVVDRVGGRLAAPVRKALAQWDRMYHASRAFNDKASQELASLQILAMKSHRIKWGLLQKQGLGSAAKDYATRVLNELNASWQ